MCPVVKELQKRKNIQSVVCVTGQHRELLSDVLNAFSVLADYNLSIMKEGQTLFDLTTLVLEKLQPILRAESPDLVLVHGDTTTAFAAGLACFYLHIPVGHVEAGLRTHDLAHPFPEEFNRRAIAVLASIHFAPTEAAIENLLREGVQRKRIFLTGNTVIDALKATVTDAFRHPILAWASGSRLLLITTHRRESIGDAMLSMLSGIRRAIARFSDCKAVLPMHPNPSIRKIMHAALDGHERIRLIEPLCPHDFHNILARCHLVLTDSGGVQEEAIALGKPTLVLRDTTERTEGVVAGGLRLVGTSEEAVLAAVSSLLQSADAYNNMANAKNPYGDGTAASRIADLIENT